MGAEGDELTTPVSTPAAAAAESPAVASLGSASVGLATPASVARPVPPPRRRRALSFDDVTMAESIDELEEEEEEDRFGFEMDEDTDLDGSGGLPASCLWEVLRRLPPVGMLSAARVCRGWRETTKRLWRAAEELRLRVPAKAQIGFVGSVLQKCPGLLKLSLKIERLGL